MATLIAMQIADIDEFDRSVSGNKVHLSMKTSTPLESGARLKARLKTLLTFPPRFWEITSIREAERGALWKTYIIDMELDKRMSSDNAIDTIKNMFKTRVLGDRIGDGDSLFVLGA